MDKASASFGQYVFDAGVLFRNGTRIGLGSRAATLLQTLLERRGQVVSKSDLMAAAWPDIIVEESNLTVQMATLRNCLRGSADDPDWIATVPRVGYRFLSEAYAVAAGAHRPADLARLDVISIAVLPFANMSSDPEQEYFADGIAEDLITDLSKVPGLLVIARNSAFAYRHRDSDLRAVAGELGVRYVVEGSVRRAANRVRISAQLIDTESQNHLWAERFDRELADIFAVQDEVVGRIVGALSEALCGACLAGHQLSLRRAIPGRGAAIS
jgi:TolB-like protein